jgi:hypothetical protein
MPNWWEEDKTTTPVKNWWEEDASVHGDSSVSTWSPQADLLKAGAPQEQVNPTPRQRLMAQENDRVAEVNMLRGFSNRPTDPVSRVKDAVVRKLLGDRAADTMIQGDILANDVKATVLPSIGKGMTSLAQAVPAVMATGQDLRRSLARKVGNMVQPGIGDQAASYFANTENKAPKEAVEFLEGGKEYLDGKMPETANFILKDDATGEEYLNPDAFKDVKNWTKILGEEAPAMALQVLLAQASAGTTTALNPALLAKLQKAGKIGKLAIKALGWGVKAAPQIGFETLRTIEPVRREAKAKFIELGMSPEEAEESSAVWGSLSSIAQGTAGGMLESKLLEQMLKGGSHKALYRALRYLGTGLKEGNEEGVQSLIQSAVAKMSYDPKLTLASAVRQASVEAAGGVLMGGAMHGAGHAERGKQYRANAFAGMTSAPTPEVEQPASDLTSAFREATPEEASRVGKYGDTMIPLDIANQFADDQLAQDKIDNPQKYDGSVSPGQQYAKTILSENAAPVPSREQRIAPMTEGLQLGDRSVSALEDRVSIAQSDLDNVGPMPTRSKDIQNWLQTLITRTNEANKAIVDAKAMTHGTFAGELDLMNAKAAEIILAQAEAAYQKSPSNRIKKIIEGLKQQIASAPTRESEVVPAQPRTATQPEPVVPTQVAPEETKSILEPPVSTPEVEGQPALDRRVSNEPVDLDRRAMERRSRMREEVRSQKPVEQMTPEEMAQEVQRLRSERMLSEKIPDMANERAFNAGYEEGNPVASLDVRSLKAVNEYGQHVGDEYLIDSLSRLNRIAKESGALAAQRGGDEALMTHADPTILQKVIDQVNAELKENPFTFIDPKTNEQVQIQGEFHHGIHSSPEAADRAMAAAKKARKQMDAQSQDTGRTVSDDGRVLEGKPELDPNAETGLGTPESPFENGDSIEFLNSGLNVQHALADILGMKRGASWSEMAPVAMEKIGRLGATVKETAIRIMNKIKGITRELADVLAKSLHESFSGSRKSQLGAIGPDLNQQLRENIKRQLEGDDKKAARAEAYKSIDTVIQAPGTVKAGAVAKNAIDVLVDGRTLSEQLDIPAPEAAKFRRELKKVSFLYMPPALISMRDRAFRKATIQFNRFIATKENIVYSYGETISKWKDIKDEKQRNILSSAVLYGTLADEGKGRRWTPADFAKHFSGATAATIDIYNQVMNQMESVKQKLIESEISRTKRLLHMAQGKPDAKRITQLLLDTHKQNIETLSNKAYFPLMRFGKYQIELTGPDGKRLGMSFIENADSESQKVALEQMAAQDPKIREWINSPEFNVKEHVSKPVEIPEKEHAAAIGDLSGSTIEYLMSTKEYDNDMLKAVELALTAQNAWSRRLEHRQGLAGYSMDALRVYQAYSGIVGNRIANNTHGLDMDAAIEALGRKARGEQYDSRLEQEAKEVLDHIRNPPFHPIASKLNLLSFIWDLGFRVSFAMTNLTQQGVMGVTVFNNFYGMPDTLRAQAIGNRIAIRLLNVGDIEAGIEGLTPAELESKIANHITPQMFSGYQDPTGTAALVSEVLRAAVADGELRPKVSQDLLGTRESSLKGKAETIIDSAASAAGYLASKSEQQNRIATLVAAVLLAKKNGKVVMDEKGWHFEPLTDDAVDTREFTEFMNRIINFGGGRGNMVPYQRQKGAWGGLLMVATQYKPFFTNMVGVIHNLGVLNARNAANKSMANRAFAYAKPQLKSMAIMTLIGGPSSTIPWMMLRTALKAALGDDQWLQLQKEIREDLATFYADSMVKMGLERDEKAAKRLAFATENGLTNAAPEGLGVNMNAAMTPSLIMSPNNASVWEDLGHLVAGPGGGKMVSLMEEVQKRGIKEPEGYMKGLEKNAPRGFSSIYKTYRGTAKIGGSEVKLEYPELVLQALAFQPTRISQLQQVLGAKIEASGAKKEFISLWRERIKSDPERKFEARQNIRDWNESHRGEKNMKIDFDREVNIKENRAIRGTEQLAEEAGVTVETKR